MENIKVEIGKNYNLSIEIPKIEELESILNRLESLEREMKSINEVLEEQKNNQTLKNQDLESELNEIKKQKNILESEKRYLEKEVENYREKNEKLERELEEKELEIRNNVIKLEEIELEKIKAARERDSLQLNNNRLKNELENLDTLVKPYEEISYQLIGNPTFNDLRNSLKITSENSIENKFRISYALENIDRLIKEITSFYSERQQSLSPVDKIFIEEINKFYNKEVLFLPKEGDEFDFSKMYDIEKPDRRFKKIKTVYSPGIIAENVTRVKAKVNGSDE